MIIGIFGLPRAGKTTTGCAIAQSALKGKRFLPELRNDYEHVYTSFYCKDCCKFNFEDLKKYSFPNSLVIIDEISLYADNRQFKNFDDSVLYFFKMHGHFHIDCVWLSQSACDADKKIRDVTDTLYLLEPSRFPNTSIIKKIYHNYSFKNRQISDCYDIASRIEWKYINRKKWYQYFDSYEHKEIPVFDKIEKW